MGGELLAEGADPVQPFGEDEWSASFQPVDSGFDGDACRLDCFPNIGQVEGDLYNWFHHAAFDS
jgi:hypothetical protein